MTAGDKLKLLSGMSGVSAGVMFNSLTTTDVGPYANSIAAAVVLAINTDPKTLTVGKFLGLK